MRRLFNDGPSAKTIRQELEALQRFWEDRGMRLEELADGGWRFRTAPGAMTWLARLEEERPARYSRAAMETLAIIAYRQPVTRGDIEEIRGVTLTAQLLKQFEDRGWIETVGWRETPGRPALLGTTKKFLNDLGLKSLAELPNLKEAPSEEFELGDENPEAQESPGIGSMQLQEELNFDQERNEGSRESPAGPADEEAHALPRAHEEAPSDASASGSGGRGNAGGSGV